jgi:nitrogen fixation protein FixH
MKKGLGWPISMAAILVSVVAANIWVAVIANDDPSFAIEPDYYQKAVAWDSSMAQARHNAALNWSLVPTLGAFAADKGARLSVRLTDSTGSTIHDARIHVAALYNARANAVYTATLGPDGPDGYVATLPVHHAGEWELRFEVRRGADRFTATARVEAVPAGLP